MICVDILLRQCQFHPMIVREFYPSIISLRFCRVLNCIHFELIILVIFLSENVEKTRLIPPGLNFF